ncbi:MAG: CoA transferase [Hydrogenophaga sp.]|uniref:CaiB/BaiF CoA transferase family protein n=1 Tax=Hydrogenophaga sp. TaxID=1904254 RepID=UPI001E0FFA42|nr:CoA transferase [Hydrogenophaga sp.]MBX3608754.1 CoA transferase [Hydrogenophaga sp.]
MFLPLQGVRVVDLSHVIAGPLASFYLAQLGAEVIKIEPPSGDVMRNAKQEEGDLPDGFVALNAGKQSAVHDIRTPEGLAAVRELARGADVFIENLRPGTVARYGLGEASLREINPSLVYCSISGYGQQGEWSQRGAYDHVIQALTGMMMMSGDDPDGPPVKVGFPVIDVAAGVLASMAIMGALTQRARDGCGQTIDASMVQASLMLMYPNVSAFLSSGVEPRRVGNRGYTGSPTADTYRCCDGWLATAANTPAQFRRLAAVLDLSDLCEDERALDLVAFRADAGFVVARDLPYLRERFNAAFASRSAADMEERLNAEGVPAARVRSLGEFVREVRDGDKVTMPAWQFAQGERRVHTAGLGFHLAASSMQISRPGAPALGAGAARTKPEPSTSVESVSACD